MNVPRHRLATDQRLAAGARIVLEGNEAHYLSHVLRLQVGDTIALFSRAEGEWRAQLTDIRKKTVGLTLAECLRPRAEPSFHLMVCFAPIKGGRLETIIEKATELGASVLQPVITRRTIVDKVNRVRAEAIAREAAEQCERIDWPEIREPVKLEKLLGDWPADLPLIYGDETGGGQPIAELVTPSLRRGPATTDKKKMNPGVASQTGMTGNAWGLLTGPEGGFAPEELAMLKRLKPAIGVGLGPRILRADTAIITLCAVSLSLWGDWHRPPRTHGDDS